MKGHIIGTGTGREADTLFDTPSLIEIWRTAPYLHDGRALNLDEMIRNFNDMELHGKTAALTADEVADLLEYLLSR